jgi:hypothetical protein
MNSGEIDRFPVNQLEGRYNLARSAVYKRMEQLGIVPERLGKRAYITAPQLYLMDELHSFINQGGSAAEFVEARGLRQRPKGNGSSPGQGANGPSSSLANNPGDLGSFISAIVSEVVTRIGGVSEPDPLQYFDRLESAARNSWLLSTSEIAGLLDLSPREIEDQGDSFFEAGFIFSRSGYRKNGEIAWRVTKRAR